MREDWQFSDFRLASTRHHSGRRFVCIWASLKPDFMQITSQCRAVCLCFGAV
jgi:hypothetical protein